LSLAHLGISSSFSSSLSSPDRFSLANKWLMKKHTKNGNLDYLAKVEKRKNHFKINEKCLDQTFNFLKLTSHMLFNASGKRQK
jgi:hypothetical protein